MQSENSSSGVNTILIVIVLLVVVGVLVWFFSNGRTGAPQEDGQNTDNASIEVNIPNGGDEGSGNEGE